MIDLTQGIDGVTAQQAGSVQQDDVLAGSRTLPAPDDERYECPAPLDDDTSACYTSGKAPYGAAACRVTRGAGWRTPRLGAAARCLL